ncbi:MAG: carbohydrate-binding protein [Phycisphaerales bacterium]
MGMIGSVIVFAGSLMPLSAGGDEIWGRLANAGFENEPIKSVFFFTGSSRDGVPFYECNPTPNTGLYTIHPSDARHLKWSESQTNRAFAIDTIIEAGANVINMSYWGLRGTDNWAYWAPMQTSTFSHDELFQATIGKNILIAPYIETYAATQNSPAFSFLDDFPGDLNNPAPLLVARIRDLIDRYILHPTDSRWASKWAQVYDRFGEKRYLVCIIQVASNQQDVTDQRFAEGFDRVADRIYQNTGVRVGFALDVMPPGTYLWADFIPSAESTGPWLAEQSSVAAIQCYFSGHSIGVNDEDTIIRWKQQFASKWINTGIPFIQDISPGYDAHIVFPGPHIFGSTATWRDAQSALVRKLACQGVTFSAWNGYTEGYAGVPTTEYGDAACRWAQDVFGNFAVGGRHPLPGRIEAEDCDQMAGVEKADAEDDGGGFYIGWLDNGDWLDYKIAVPTDDEYFLRLRVTAVGSSGGGQVTVGGAVLTSVSIPATGGWQSWQTIETTIPLEAGDRTLRLRVVGGGWNLNWLELMREADRNYHELPGRIEAEEYDDMVGIKTEIVLNEDAGFNVGWFDTGDWLEYLVDVEKAGRHTASLRVALDSAFAGGRGRLETDAGVLWSFSVPATGGWQSWQTITAQVDLPAGKRLLRLRVDQGPWNLNWLEFTATAKR